MGGVANGRFEMVASGARIVEETAGYPVRASALLCGRDGSAEIRVLRRPPLDCCHNVATVVRSGNDYSYLQGFSMGGTGLEPVTPSLSSWCSPN